jgi:hypothetical protein
LDRVVTLELDPDGFVQPGTLDELQLAAFNRDIEDVHDIMMLTAPSKLDVSLQRNARAFPLSRLRACVWILLHAAAPSERRLRVNYRRYARRAYYT